MILRSDRRTLSQFSKSCWDFFRCINYMLRVCIKISDRCSFSFEFVFNISFSSSVHCIINTYLFPRLEPQVFIGTMVTNPFSLNWRIFLSTWPWCALKLSSFFSFETSKGKLLGWKSETSIKVILFNWNTRFALITLTEKSDQLCKNTSSSNIGTYPN